MPTTTHAVPALDEQALRTNRTLPPFAGTQKPLALVPGMVDAAGVEEVLLVCRKE